MNFNGLIRKTLVLLFVFVGLILGIGFTLPNQFHVERTLVIDAPPATVFPYVNDLENWQRWDPWSQDDPRMVRTFTGGPGQGQTQSWMSQASGTGTLEILESTPLRSAKLKLTTRASSYPRFLSFKLVDLGEKTQLTWAIDGENSMKPIGNYFGLGMNRYLGPMYEQGLSNLKSLVETGALPELVEAKKKRAAEKAEELRKQAQPTTRGPSGLNGAPK
ncbi:MAG: SRPBCC family protein [Myxococcota bacterium]|nr:SRPBCC family protein [Myxococcota bacterium]